MDTEMETGSDNRESSRLRNLLDRYRTLLKKYQLATAQNARRVSLGHWLMFQAQEGVALMQQRSVLLANRRFYYLCSVAGRVECLSDPEPSGNVRLYERVTAIAQDMLESPPDGEEAPPARRLVFRSAGGPLHIEAEINRFGTGRPGLVAVVLRDITDTESLRLERQEGQRRDQFLAMLAHELRNPLAPIVSAAELILRHTTDETVKEAAGRILRQGLHQARLVEDLLDTARVRQGKIVLHEEIVDLCGVVREAADSTEPMRDGQVRLEVVLPEQLVWVRGDRTRLAQCLVNLLTNAAKFTRPGGRNWIEVRSSGDRAWVQVRDDGIGIAEELLPRIFDVFTQGTEDLDRPRGGLGLGLALVKSLMELHHGGVRADSAGQGLGAEVTLWLPLVEARKEAAQAREETGALPQPKAAERGLPPGSLVLVVEDNADIRDTLRDLLYEEGFQVLSAANGSAGVELALSSRPRCGDLGPGAAPAFRLRSGGAGAPGAATDPAGGPVRLLTPGGPREGDAGGL